MIDGGNAKTRSVEKGSVTSFFSFPKTKVGYVSFPNEGFKANKTKKRFLNMTNKV